MRNLRPAEAAVAQTVLSGVDADAASPRLPRRTRQTVRRRLADWGWFRETYLPDLAQFGWSHLEFALVEPFADRRADTIAALRSVGSVGLLWVGSAMALAVYPSIGPGTAPDLPAVFERSGAPRSLWTLAANPSEGEIPVYFDFEAAWVRRWGLVAPRAYPQSFPCARAEAHPEEGPSLTDADTRTIRTLVGEGSSREGNPSRNGPTHPGVASVERCLRHGWVSRRAFLNPVAAYHSVQGFPTQMVFVHGSLNDGVAGETPFRDLVSESGVGPFLYATDHREVLIGALAMGPGMRRGSDENRWAAILPTLRKSIYEIVVLREPLDGVRIEIDHDYAGLLEGPSASTP